MTDQSANTKLSHLFEVHYNGVLAYCARRIGRSEAEDAAADVFAIAARRVDEIDWTTVRPWLYGVARGVLANRWRSLHRRQRMFALMAGRASDVGAGPDDVILRRAEDQETIKALQQMRPPDREVLMLAAWEELTGPQIAHALGISVAAAEQRIHRAKQRYARTLQRVTGAADRYGLAVNDTGGGS